MSKQEAKDAAKTIALGSCIVIAAAGVINTAVTKDENALIVPTFAILASEVIRKSK